MAITPAFTVAQSSLSKNLVTITDTSAGSDAEIASRRVYVQTSTGQYLVPSGTTTDYTAWSYADSSIILNILEQDTAAAILVQWLDSGNAVLYELENTYALAQYGKNFFYYLLQQQGLKPGIYQDLGYATNLVLFYANLVGGINAIAYGNDISASQNCFNREILMKQTEGITF